MKINERIKTIIYKNIIVMMVLFMVLTTIGTVFSLKTVDAYEKEYPTLIYNNDKKGTPINPNLTRIQTEGGILQGIGMALSENVTYTKKGNVIENSFMEYKIPSRLDIEKITVDFEPSYENLGPYGAKSIGEVVINTPSPAIQEAIYQACGKRFYELPITSEDIALANE